MNRLSFFHTRESILFREISYTSGWWFGTFSFSHILGIIIPIDFHIFQRGGPTTNQTFIHSFWFVSSRWEFWISVLTGYEHDDITTTACEVVYSTTVQRQGDDFHWIVVHEISRCLGSFWIFFRWTALGLDGFTWIYIYHNFLAGEQQTTKDRVSIQLTNINQPFYRGCNGITMEHNATTNMMCNYRYTWKCMNTWYISNSKFMGNMKTIQRKSNPVGRHLFFSDSLSLETTGRCAQVRSCHQMVAFFEPTDLEGPGVSQISIVSHWN